MLGINTLFAHIFMIQDDLAFGISSLRPIHGRGTKWAIV